MGPRFLEIKHIIWRGDIEKLGDALDDMPWDELLNGRTVSFFVWGCSCFCDATEKSRVDEALQMVMDQALKEGRTDVFETWMSGDTDGPAFIEPIRRFVTYGAPLCLQRYLESGFDPTQQYGEERISSIEHARRYGRPDLAELMSSFVRPDGASTAPHPSVQPSRP